MTDRVARRLVAAVVLAPEGEYSGDQSEFAAGLITAGLRLLLAARIVAVSRSRSQPGIVKQRGAYSLLRQARSE